MMQAGNQTTLRMLGSAVRAPVGLADARGIIHDEHQRRILLLAQQRQTGLSEPGACGQVDVDAACELRRRGQFSRREPGELGGAMQHAAESTQLGLQTLCERGIVVRRRAGQIQRVQQWCCALPGQRVIDTLERAQLAAQQHHGGTCLCAGLRGRSAQAAGGAGDQHDPPGQRRCSGCLRAAHGW